MKRVPQLELTWIHVAVIALLAGCGGSDPEIHVDPQTGALGQGEGAECDAQNPCARGLSCVGEPGCGAPWTCQSLPERVCTTDLVTFCGCDGNEFQGSGSCPAFPHTRRGYCEQPSSEGPGESEPGTAGAACTSSEQCTDGLMCTGEAGCDTAWTCQPARPCTRDLRPYCSCGGETVQGSGSCPPVPYAYRGACGTQ